MCRHRPPAARSSRRRLLGPQGSTGHRWDRNMPIGSPASTRRNRCYSVHKARIARRRCNPAHRQQPPQATKDNIPTSTDTACLIRMEPAQLRKPRKRFATESFRALPLQYGVDPENAAILSFRIPGRKAPQLRQIKRYFSTSCIALAPTRQPRGTPVGPTRGRFPAPLASKRIGGIIGKTFTQEEVTRKRQPGRVP